MDQLYYTSCRLRRSVNGQSGFQVRAASAGLEPARLRAATGYVGYGLPDRFPPTPEAVPTAPVRLALLDTPDLGRVLAHTVYVGQEGQGTRGGNFFTHLVAGLPDEFDPEVAAGLWGSPFWRRADADDIDTALPDPVLPPRAPPAGFDPVRFLANSRLREMVGFIMDAVLTSGPAGRRLYLVARPVEVAGCVYLAARALPKPLRHQLTFSTYEAAPASARAFVVGVDPDGDVPSFCFAEPALGFHPASGRRSPSATSTTYARSAAAQFANDQFQKVDDFVRWVTKSGIAAPGLVECGFLIATDRAADLSPDQITAVLGHPALTNQYLLKSPDLATRLTAGQLRAAMAAPEVAGVVLKYPAAVDRVVGLATTDAKFHADVVPQVVELLQAEGADPESRNDLSEETRNRLTGWVAIQKMATDAELKQDWLKYVGQELASVPAGARKARRDAVILGVAEALKTASRANLTRAVEAAVTYLYPENPQAVYAALCQHLAGKAGFYSSQAGVTALLAVGLGEGQNHVTEMLGDVAADEAAGLVRALKRTGKKNILTKIRSSALPKGSAERWKKKPSRDALRRLTRPPLLNRVFGNFWVRVVLVAAVLGAAGVVVVVKWDAIRTAMKSL